MPEPRFPGRDESLRIACGKPCSRKTSSTVALAPAVFTSNSARHARNISRQPAPSWRRYKGKTANAELFFKVCGLIRKPTNEAQIQALAKVMVDEMQAEARRQRKARTAESSTEIAPSTPRLYARLKTLASRSWRRVT